VKNGLDVLAGVIDSDYRGELCCALLNTGNEPIKLAQGSRLCQLIIEQIITPTPIWSDELEDTSRGAGGFGSTG
jgi:dUTP pyrophosphatase